MLLLLLLGLHLLLDSALLLGLHISVIRDLLDIGRVLVGQLSIMRVLRRSRLQHDLSLLGVRLPIRQSWRTGSGSVSARPLQGRRSATVVVVLGPVVLPAVR